MDALSGNSLARNVHKIYGVVVGVVTDNKDPEGLYRVKIKYPTQMNSGDESSFWARIATMGAGKNSEGWFWLPEVDDEVLVAFENGEIAHPYVIGALWNSSNPAHLDNKSQDGKNHKRTLKTRSGHILEFNDNDKDKVESITLKTKAGHTFCLDDTDSKLKAYLVDCKSENSLILDTQNKKITLQTDSGDMLIKAKGEIKIECKTLNVKSTDDTNFEAKNWNAKAQSNFTLEASGSGTVKSGGTMTIKGSTVNIN